MTTRQPLYKSLYFQVIVAIVIGILLGHFYPQTGVALKPLGDGFIKLIKMVIAPIIFCTVVSGIAGMQSMKSVGKTGGYALLYFEIVSTIALLIGLVVVNVVQPGAGMHIDVATLDASKVAAYVTAGADQSIVGFLLNVIPNTIVGAFATGDILQVLMFSVIFGFALHRLGAYGKPVLDFIDRFAHVMFNIINMIMKLAPLGALGAMAFTIGAYGVGSLVQLGQLMICFYITCILFVVLVLGAICRAHGFSVLKLIRYIREELLIVLGTSSSESALPRMLIKMERLGAKKSVVGLVIPTGYSFRDQLLDHRIGVFLDDVVLDPQFLEVGRQHMLGKTRLLLVHVHGNDVELDRRDLLQVHQHVEHGVAVLAAGQADHDLVALFDHIEIGDCLAGQATQAFLQFVLVDRKSAHGAWIRERCVTKSRVFYRDGRPSSNVGAGLLANAKCHFC